MTAAHGTTDRLFRHDGIIAVNTMRSAFAGWWDRLIAAALLVVMVVTLRGWFSDLAWTVAVWAACGGTAILGCGAQRLISARLSFHGFDGLLAADALNPAVRRRYGAAWHGVALTALATVVLIARPSLLIVAIPGYLAGVVVARLVGGVRTPHLGRGGRRTTWLVRSRLHDPSAGVAAALLLIAVLLSARGLGERAVLAVAGIATALLGLALTAVEDRVVRFMAIVGHGSIGTVVRHAKGLLTFAGLSVVSGGVIVGVVAAGLIAAVSLALLLFVALRILAYRLHGKRIADVLVGIVVGLILLVGYAVPVAVPLVVIAVLWHLYRRGRAKTWSLA